MERKYKRLKAAKIAAAAAAAASAPPAQAPGATGSNALMSRMMREMHVDFPAAGPFGASVGSNAAQPASAGGRLVIDVESI